MNETDELENRIDALVEKAERLTKDRDDHRQLADAACLKLGRLIVVSNLMVLGPEQREAYEEWRLAR